MDNEVPHTGGAVSGFTPNMSKEQVAEYDRRRGLGDMGAFNDPDLLINKRPWLRPDGTHKSNGEGDMSKTQEAINTLKAMIVPEHGENFAKDNGKALEQTPYPGSAPSTAQGSSTSGVINVPKKPLREGTFGNDRLPKVVVGGKSIDKDDEGDDEMSDLSDKLFGKSDQQRHGMAAAQRERQRMAGRRERQIGMRHAGTGKALESEDDDVDVLEQLLDHEKKEAEEEKKALPGELAHMQASDGGTSPRPAPSPPPMPPSSPSAGGAGVGPSMSIGKGMEILKALNSRSMHIPAPHGPYDPFNVMRSATSVPTSGPQRHEGQTVTLRAEAETHDACPTHGLTYRKSLGCHPCNLAKSQECQTCGAGMMKSFGGVMRCPRGH